MAYSILIKNGTVIDGSGKDPYPADIGISGDRIEKMGNLSGDTAKKVIDATNLYITPGFIDLTSHSDVYGTLFLAPSQESLLKQGVTTILMGNCGESLAPIVETESLANLERWAAGVSVPINWNGVGEYFENIEKLGIGLNAATLIGQDTLKRNGKSLQDMVFLLEKAFEEGAWGLSSNFLFSARSDEEEKGVLELLKVVKKYNGLYKIHLRDEGKTFLPAVASAIALARASGARTIISHFKAIGRDAWPESKQAIKMIWAARKEGVNISFDVFPYQRTGSMLMAFLPEWARLGDNTTILKRLEDTKTRFEIIAALKNITLHPDKILFASVAHDKTIVGKTLADVAERTSMSPEEVILDVLKINDLNVLVFGRTIASGNLLNALKEPGSIMASDGAGYDISFQRFGGLPHPRSFGAFPRFFRSIAQKSGLSLSKAVEKITSLPAAAIGLKDRGLIKQKYIADIAIFHPEEFKDRATYKNPYNYAEGLRYLLISGNLSIAEGKALPERNGLVLKRYG